MADQEDVRRIALALPDTSEATDHFSFSVRNKGKQKGFVWAWNERVEPGKPRVPRPDVVAIRVLDRFDKEALLASDGKKFFTEPHYGGFPAVLVRLPIVEVGELEELILDAWRCQAPRALVDAFEGARHDGIEGQPRAVDTRSSRGAPERFWERRGKEEHIMTTDTHGAR